MLKLKQLQQKQKEAKQPTSTESAPSGPQGNGDNTSGSTAPAAPPGGFVLKRQSSKELQEVRKTKSKESVFTLRSSTKGAKGKGKKQNAAELRAQKDISEMDKVPGCKVEFPDPSNLMEFNILITPNDGLYKDAEFKFTATIPQTYPYDPPKVVCNTLIYHPNIDWEGHVCLNILRADWMPVLNLGSVLFGLVTLFVEPNPDDPLNKEAAQLMIENYSKFEQNVKQSLRGGNVCGRQFPKLINK